MVDLPTIEQVLEAIDRLPAEWSPVAGPLAGHKHVGYYALSQALFPKGSPLWHRPKGKPHGLDYSPAWKFMDDLGRGESGNFIRVARFGGRTFYARKP